MNGVPESVTQQRPKIADLLSHAFLRVQERYQLLLLLAALAGLVSSLLFAPAYNVMTDFAKVLQEGSQDASATKAIELLSDRWPALIWGQLMVTALNAILLIPWARAVLGNGLAPYDEDFNRMVRRSFRAFWHMTLANILLISAVLTGASVLNALLSAVGFLALVLVFAGIFILVWFAIFINAVANYAVVCEASDQPTTLALSWRALKPNARPAAASLAIFFLMYFFLSSLLSSGLNGLGLGYDRVWLIISGTLSFLLSALHVAALTVFFRPTRVDEVV